MKIVNIRNRIIKRLSLYITFIALLTFLILLAYNYYESKKIILDDIRDNTQMLVNATLLQINTILITAQEIPQEISYVIDYGKFDKADIEKFLKEVVEHNKNIYGCAIAFEPYMFDKNRFFYSPYYYRPVNKVEYKDVGTIYDYFKYDWYSVPKKLMKGVWSEPYFGPGGSTYMITYSEPFFRTINDKKEFCGIVECDISLSWLEELISKIKIYDTGYAFVLSPKGVFIAHPNKEYIIKQESFFTLANKFKDKKEEELAERMLKGQSGYERYYSHNSKKTCYLYYQPIAATGCILGVVIPENELLIKLRFLTFTLFLIGAIGNLPSLVLKIAAKGVLAPFRSTISKVSEWKNKFKKRP